MTWLSSAVSVTTATLRVARSALCRLARAPTSALPGYRPGMDMFGSLRSPATRSGLQRSSHTHEARIALYDMAHGDFEGQLGQEMATDPADPPIVKMDILNQGHPETLVMAHAPEWGWRGSMKALQGQLALHQRANQWGHR